jgi:hypothetical protein
MNEKALKKGSKPGERYLNESEDEKTGSVVNLIQLAQDTEMRWAFRNAFSFHTMKKSFWLGKEISASPKVFCSV